MKEYSFDFLEQAHKGCSCHKTEILNENLCGCFYCEAKFESSDIIEWIDENGKGETALCPKCGIDSVLSSKWPVNDPMFLKVMHSYWFAI